MEKHRLDGVIDRLPTVLTRSECKEDPRCCCELGRGRSRRPLLSRELLPIISQWSHGRGNVEGGSGGCDGGGSDGGDGGGGGGIDLLRLWRRHQATSKGDLQDATVLANLDRDGWRARKHANSCC